MSGWVLRRARRMRGLAAALGLAVGFYLLLIDTLDLPELYAGGGVVLLAVALFAAAREPRGQECTPRTRWWLRSWRAVAHVPADIWWASVAAFAQLVRRRESYGSLRAVPFGGGEDASREAGRRALAEALGSLTPNTIVVGVDTDSGLILAHELRRGHDRTSIDVLGLG